MLSRIVKHQRSEAQPPASSPERQREERALVEAAQNLDDGAWAEIYARNCREIYAYIYHRIGDPHVAEDLAADVFVRAIAGIKGYTWRGTPLLAWLYRIAHNTTVDYIRSAARHAEHTSDRDAAATEDGANELSRWDERRDMIEAIRTLTDDQQQVLTLRFYGGMSTAEVSRVIGKPEGAVKALQARGLRSLGRTLTETERSA